MPPDDSALLTLDHAREASARPSSANLSAAIYIHDFSPGGVERQCMVLARELQARGVDITLVVHKVQGELVPLIPKGLPVVSLNGRRTLNDVVHLRRFIRDEQPSILMANVDHNNIAAAMANAVSGTATKLIICQHNPLSAGYHATVNWKHRVVPLGYRMLSSWIDHAVAVSPGIAQELVTHGRIPTAKVTTILNAVIGSDFQQRAAAPADHPWLVHRDRPVFVTAGRLVQMKDHPTLLRAFAQQLPEHPSRLIVMGTGPMETELRELARDLEITEHVDLVGFVQNPLPLMRAADAFVLSSRSEGFGNVLVEAMGCGTPVLATDCPHGPADILGGGRYGLLVPPQDPDALARALPAVLAQRHRWPAKMLQERAQEFSYGNCADAYWRLFLRVAD